MTELSAKMEMFEVPGAGRQTRREFCTNACRIASIAAIGGAVSTLLQGCGGGNPAAPSSVQALPLVAGTLSGASVLVTVDAASPLAAVGSAAMVQVPNGVILVAHVAQNSFTALSAACTHAACTITGYGSGTFVCPCHGSQFDTSGRVVGGPAPANLLTFGTSFASGVLTITA
jgi:cytochrome b6-f complex iron-sulfur subunit